MAMSTIRLPHPGDPAVLLASEIVRQAIADERSWGQCSCGRRRSLCASTYLSVLRSKKPDALHIALDMLGAGA